MSAHTIQEPGQAPVKKSLISKLKIPGIILGIVALEWMMAFLIMPGSNQAEPIAPASAAMIEEAAPAEADASHEEEHASESKEASDHGKASHDAHGQDHENHGQADPHVP